MFLIVVVPLYSPPFVLQLDQDFETSLQKPTRKKFPVILATLLKVAHELLQRFVPYKIIFTILREIFIHKGVSTMVI